MPPRRRPAPTVAALPQPPARRKIRREDKPFDPVGLLCRQPQADALLRTERRLRQQSVRRRRRRQGLGALDHGDRRRPAIDWSRNELTGSAKLGYNEYFQTPGASAPYGSGVVDYRYDVSRDLSFDTEGRFNLATETNAQLGLGGAPIADPDASLDLWRDASAAPTSSAT